jgi:HEXXH motif-containing protein
VAAADFAALAAGSGDINTILTLRAAQISRRIVMLRALLDTASSRPDVPPPVQACLTDGFALLAAAARRSRSAVDDVLAYPLVGAWLVHCLRRLRGHVVGTVSLDDDLGYFGGVVVAAAVRAGEAVDVLVRASSGRVFLPTIGYIRLPAIPWARVRVTAGSSHLVVSIDDGEGNGDVGEGNGDVADVDLGGPATRQWVPLRRLRSTASGCTLDVAVEDADPYRGCGMLGVAGPLDDGELARWQVLLDEVWSILAEDHRQQAEALSAGVNALVPLNSAWQVSSATSGVAFGALALASPVRATELATTLVHEFAHTKLYALLDMVPLLEAPADVVCYAPWRSDPRPMDGLLQGAYAFLALAEFWSTRRSAGGAASGREAAFELARWRDGVALALDTLSSSGRLTAVGRRFVSGMGTSLARRCVESVDEDVAARARDVATAHWVTWRIQHTLLDPYEVDRCVRAWLAGDRCPHPVPAARVTPGSTFPEPPESPESSEPSGGSLEHLVGQWLADPTGFSDNAADAADAARRGTATPGSEGAVAAATALVVGDYAGAVELYKRRIAEFPDDVSAWVGLAVARRHAVTAATPAFVSCPEVVRVLHARLRLRQSTSTGAPDPDGLAVWVGRRVETASAP